MSELVTSGGQVADCNQLNTPHLMLPTVARNIKEKKEKSPIWIRCYCRNVTVQHGGRPAASVQWN